MALVSSSHRDHRIYEPSIQCDYPTRQEQSQFRSRLLVKIHNFYYKALERLNLRARPSMAARFLYGGFCFGLLDPVSNIITNTLLPFECLKRGGEKATSDVVTQSKLRELERRSLDGLVTFLTRFFPYLADCEAVRYLLLADADVLVAARIIALDRHIKNFGSFDDGRLFEDEFTMAFKCAALAARHPEPDRLVSAWARISTVSPLVVKALSRVRRRSWSFNHQAGPDTNETVTGLFTGRTSPRFLLKSIYMWTPWHLAASRRPRRCSVPYQHTTALKRILLDSIHAFYLKALVRLPTGELQSRYHRSLLTAGHCYGPLDPVSNIILNTIWYDAAFPRTHELEMDMVSTLSLHRIENRSLYGIISFLCTRYHHLDFHQAACCLLDADANLVGADPNLDAAAATAFRREEGAKGWSSGSYDFRWSTTSGFPTTLGRVDTLDKCPDTSVNEAFKAAAVAACHPKPDDQVNLLTLCKKKLGSALSLLQGGDPLSSKDVQQLARLLCPESPCSEQPLPPFPLEEYLYDHTRISKKVNAVLNAYMQRENKEVYQVHIICGVNSQVSGPVYCLGGSKFAPHKCLRTHVNFIATRRGSQSQADGVLFFAELSNDDEIEDKAGAQSFCCPVMLPPPCAERVRCLYCDYVGTRIVHPTMKDFHGRRKDFEKMVCGEDPCDENFDPAVNRAFFTNLSVIRHSRLIANEIGSLEEDCLYADSFDGPKRDAHLDFDLFMDVD